MFYPLSLQLIFLQCLAIGASQITWESKRVVRSSELRAPTAPDPSIIETKFSKTVTPRHQINKIYTVGGESREKAMYEDDNHNPSKVQYNLPNEHSPGEMFGTKYIVQRVNGFKPQNYSDIRVHAFMTVYDNQEQEQKRNQPKNVTTFNDWIPVFTQYVADKRGDVQSPAVDKYAYDETTHTFMVNENDQYNPDTTRGSASDETDKYVQHGDNQGIESRYQHQVEDKIMEHKDHKEKTKVKHHHHHHHHNHVKTVYQKVPYPVKVMVPQPYPVEKKIRVPVEKIVEKIVEKEVPYPVIKKVPYKVEVKVPQPYPVKVIEKQIVHVPNPHPIIKHVPVEVKVAVPAPYPVEKKVPYPVEVKVPYPVEKKVPYLVKVEVEKKIPVPVRIYVPQPYPVEKKVHIPVEVKVKEPYPVVRHIPYPIKVPVDRPVPYPVPKPYPVHVEKRIPIPVPVVKEKMVKIPMLISHFPQNQRHIELPNKLPERPIDFKSGPVTFDASHSMPYEIRVPVPFQLIIPQQPPSAPAL